MVHTFTRSRDRAYTLFEASGAGNGGCGEGTYPAVFDGLNPFGFIAGVFVDGCANRSQHGYVRSPDGTFTIFDAPGTFTYVVGISPFGFVAGQYVDDNGVSRSFVRDPFGNIATFQVAGAGTGSNQGTFANSINLIGQVAGNYTDANNVNHGFVRGPFGGTQTFDVPGAGTSPSGDPNINAGTVPVANNAAGWVTGYYVDAGLAFHGFLMVPASLH